MLTDIVYTANIPAKPDGIYIHCSKLSLGGAGISTGLMNSSNTKGRGSGGGGGGGGGGDRGGDGWEGWSGAGGWGWGVF